jgi:hypothetical protein
MALARKPQAPATPPAPDVDVEALINKGGTVAAKEAPKAAKKKIQPVVVRLPSGFNTRVDKAVAARTVRIPRHTWILEAIAEKLEREGY